jgi:hypothetical protein
MAAMDGIEKSELRDYLCKSWLTHDGMWFYNTALEAGVDMANRLNKAAIKSMAPLEMQRTKKLLGAVVDAPDSDAYLAFFKTALELVLPASVGARFALGSPSRNVLRWEWAKGQCFAFTGIRMAGFIDDYECGVIYRIGCWLEALGVNYRITPEVGKCMMHEKGFCTGEIELFL